MMNLQRSSRILATGAVALALIGGGVGAALTDHWSGSQTATVTLPVSVLSITSSTPGAVVDPVARTVTFVDYAVTTPDSVPGSPGSLVDQLTVTSTGSGPVTGSATVTGDMPAAELAKFSLTDGTTVFPFSTSQFVIAQIPAGPGTLSYSLAINWTGVSVAATGHHFTVTYSIDAS